MEYFKGFAFDIDNTAVPEGSLIVTSEKLKKAFHLLSSNVIAIAATGRTIEYAKPIISELRLQHESIVANGAQILDSRSMEIISENLLSKKQVEYILNLCGIYCKNSQCCIAGDEMGSHYTSDQQVARSAAGIFILNTTKEIADTISQNIANYPEIHSYISESWSDNNILYDININNIKANKGSALRKILSKKAISSSQIIGVGDSINDISMFNEVGYKVAMADSHPDLLAMADEIVPSQSNNGLLEIVNRFI